jgi:hypothetical protein
MRERVQYGPPIAINKGCLDKQIVLQATDGWPANDVLMPIADTQNFTKRVSFNALRSALSLLRSGRMGFAIRFMSFVFTSFNHLTDKRVVLCNAYHDKSQSTIRDDER